MRRALETLGIWTAQVVFASFLAGGVVLLVGSAARAFWAALP